MRDYIRTRRDILEALTIIFHHRSCGNERSGLKCLLAEKDMTDPETQKFTKEVLEHMRNRLSDYQEQYPGELFNLEATPAESTAYRLAKHDRSRYPDIKQQEKRATLRITQTALICRLITLRIFLTHWIFRTICRLCILQEPYSMHSLGRSFRTGRQRQRWYVRSQRIIACPITPSHRPILYVRSMATSAASISPARNVERRLRFTAVSQDITVLYRTGTMVRPRSTRTVPSMILPIPS